MLFSLLNRMKAFLLAAGNGTRLLPLTEAVPKCLLPIRGVPLLQIWLENCRAAGITDVLINTHAHAEKMRDFVAAQDTGVRVVLTEEKELLGSAGTLWANRGFIASEAAFFILYADVLTNLNLNSMLEFHQDKGLAATLGIARVPDPNRCGIVTVDEDDIIQSFVEKPEHPQSDWAFSGVMVATRRMLDCVPKQHPADIGAHVLPMLPGKMRAYRIREYLRDIGTLPNYTAAQSTWPGLYLEKHYEVAQEK
jgi:mannose-1-phosphate guanylyltransferase